MTGPILATGAIGAGREVVAFAREMYAMRAAARKADAAAWDRFERENRDWLELDVLATEARMELDAALRSPTLTPDGRDRLPRLDRARLTELADPEHGPELERMRSALGRPVLGEDRAARRMDDIAARARRTQDMTQRRT